MALFCVGEKPAPLDFLGGNVATSEESTARITGQREQGTPEIPSSSQPLVQKLLINVQSKGGSS